MQTDTSIRSLVRSALAGHSPQRLLCGELILEPDLVRESVGLQPDASVPLPAEQALLERWGHDVVTISFSHGWGATQQPDRDDSLFRLSYWQEQSELFVLALVDGPFSVLAKAWNWQNALVRISKGDPEVETIMADAVMDLGELLTEVAEAGADGIIIGEDIAFRRGPYVRPEQLRRYYFPYLTLLVLSAQEHNLPVIFHSDGNLWPIWDDLLKTDIDGIQGLDPYSAMSMALARERSSPTLCLWGNLDLGWLAQPRQEQAYRAYLQELLDPLTGTPTIFGTCSGLAPGIPLEHLDRLYQAAHTLDWNSSVSKRIESRSVGL